MKRSTWLIAVGVLLMAFSFNGAEAPGNEEIEDDMLGIGAMFMVPEDTPEQELQLSPLGKHAQSNQLVVQSAELVSQLTGPGSPSRTDALWNIAGTDLGFSFEHEGKIHMVFGDTWGRAGVEGPDWRSNVMVTVESDPEHGYVITDAIGDENGEAIELIPSLKQAKDEYTVIPTSGVTVDGRMYLHYMSIQDWDKQWWGYKKPVMNRSGIAYSDDGGQTWIKDESAVWEGNSAFSQVAMVQHGQYVYVFGTPAGRFGAAVLMRVPGNQLLSPEMYTYWNGNGWTSDPAGATEVVPWPVGELSVRWNPYHQLWFMMYKNEVDHTVVLRTAPHLTGPWDDERVIVDDAEYPTLYAPFILPITGPDVYFTMSLFQPDYQVYVMKTTLNAPR